MRFLLNSFLELCGRNRSPDLIYIRLVSQYVDISKQITLSKSHDVTAKCSDDSPPPCFLEQITRDPCLKFLEKKSFDFLSQPLKIAFSIFANGAFK